MRILVVRRTVAEARIAAEWLAERGAECVAWGFDLDRDRLQGLEFDALDADVPVGTDLSFFRSRVRHQKNAAREFAEAGAHFKHAADARRFPVEPPEHPAKSHARWALDLYRECQRDAEGDPWHEPGGAERRFIARLREYAGAE